MCQERHGLNQTSEHHRTKRASRAYRRAAAIAAVPIAAVAVAGAGPAQGSAGAGVSASERALHRAGVPVAGSEWLNGKGVPVYVNRGCSELAARLYAVKGWGTVSSTRYGDAASIPEGSQSLDFYRNGSGYVPVPGDIVVEKGGHVGYGHVAVVDKVTKHGILTVEQNAVPSGRHTYPWSGRYATGAYNGRHVSGFVHSPRNDGSGDRYVPQRNPHALSHRG